MLHPDESPIFEFERDFAGSLRCIPMAVRFKLDHAGIKLSLRQWCCFTPADRALLLALRCGTVDEIRGWQATLVELIASRAREPARQVAVPTQPEWADAATVAAPVIEYSQRLGIEAPTTRHWAAMTPLQRFALLKLTRASHDNENFMPAMREFGALPP